MHSILLEEDTNGVRILTMNRTDKLNALNSELTEALVAGLQSAEDDVSVRAIILTGAGRAFCVGADTSEFSALTPRNAELVEGRAALTARLHSMVPQMSKPVIAAVDGYAIGGGAGLAVSCDYVVAGENAVFAYPEIKHGIVAAIVMTSLVKHAGRKTAFDLVSTGRRIGPNDAKSIGLVTECVSSAVLMDRARDLAAGFAAANAEAFAATKKLLNAVADMALLDGIELGRQVNARMRGFTAGQSS
jgi:enoyl-CoA hydratase/carnithine racemase